MTRKAVYELVEVREGESPSSKVYDFVMIAAIVVSLLPLCFKEYPTLFFVTDAVVTALFAIDYLLRWATADYELEKGAISFLLYPLTPMAIIDLASILPFFLPMNGAFKALRLLRFARALRAVRFVRESKSFNVIAAVVSRERMLLGSVAALAVCYVLVCALIIFNVEPDTFATFFDAIYWACVSLTTVGYGDIYPVTTLGRIVTMVSSIVGVALIALPSGIITGGYIEEMRSLQSRKDGRG